MARGFDGKKGFTTWEHDLSLLAIKGAVPMIELQVVHLVMRSSVGWQKLGVGLSYGEISNAIRKNRRDTIRAVKSLVAKGILRKLPSERKGWGAQTGYAVNHERSEWSADIQAALHIPDNEGEEADQRDKPNRCKPWRPNDQPNHSFHKAFSEMFNGGATDTIESANGGAADTSNSGAADTIERSQTLVGTSDAPPLKKGKKDKERSPLPHVEEASFSLIRDPDGCLERQDMTFEELQWQAPTWLELRFGKLTEKQGKNLELYLTPRPSAIRVKPFAVLRYLMIAAVDELRAENEADRKRFGDVTLVLRHANRRLLRSLEEAEEYRILRLEARKLAEEQAQRQKEEATPNPDSQHAQTPPAKEAC